MAKSTQTHKTPEIRVGVLHSLSGTMANDEKHLVDATLMAIDEINQSGGVLGHKVIAVVEDGKSNPNIFAAKAEKLLAEEKVATIFGCWTSASRKAVKPIVEQYNSLLWYPVQYEGLEESTNIIYTGSCLNQQITPAVDWALDKGKLKCLLLGSDYVFPRTANHLIRALVTQSGSQVLGELYVPLGSSDFTTVITAIKRLQPDIIYNTVNGDSNLAFFRKLAEAKIDANDCVVMSFSFSEIELQDVTKESLGHYACWSYFQSLQTPENTRFLKDYKQRFGTDKPVSDPIVTAYTQAYLWKQLVEDVSSFEAQQVLRSAPGAKVVGPCGILEIEKNKHAKKRALIGQVTSNGQFDVVWSSDSLIEPKPWLGIEDVELQTGGLVREVMSQYPEVVHLNSMLEKEITERKEMEEKLEKRATELALANVRLKELDRLKSMFIDSMSHEFRTPLNSVIGFTGVLLQGMAGELNTKQKDHLGRVNRSARHLLSLINDIIDISKVEAGKVETFVGEFTLDEAIGEAVEIVQPKVKEKGLALEQSVPPGIRLKTDRRRLLQCIINFLSNAVKFTEAGTISVAAQEINGEVEITVSDTGIGIAGEDLSRLFDAFVRLDSHLRIKTPGTGLGLYLTKKLATDVLGGTVAARSEPGKGSTFTLRVPKELKQKQA